MAARTLLYENALEYIIPFVERYAEMKNIVPAYEASRDLIHEIIMDYVTEPLQSEIHAGLAPGATSDFLHSAIIRTLELFAATSFVMLVHKTSRIPTDPDQVTALAQRLANHLFTVAPIPGKMHYCWPSGPALKALIIMRGTAGVRGLEDFLFSPFILPVSGTSYIRVGELSPRAPAPSNR